MNEEWTEGAPCPLCGGPLAAFHDGAAHCDDCDICADHPTGCAIVDGAS